MVCLVVIYTFYFVVVREHAHRLSLVCIQIHPQSDSDGESDGQDCPSPVSEEEEEDEEEGMSVVGSEMDTDNVRDALTVPLLKTLIQTLRINQRHKCVVGW